jgi:hypothetical protein
MSPFLMLMTSRAWLLEPVSVNSEHSQAARGCAQGCFQAAHVACGSTRLGRPRALPIATQAGLCLGL